MPDIPLRIRNQERIFGIRINNLSFKVESLNFEDDQSFYDVICNVDLHSYCQGNGSFYISFTNKDGSKGMPIGDWVIIEGCVIFDWGKSNAYFWLLDQHGVKTNRIKATSSRGSHSGFNVEALTKSILIESRDIISRFPSAIIYNAFSSFMDVKLRPSRSDVRKFLDVSSDGAIITTFLNKTINAYDGYLQRYSDLMKILSDCKDERCKRLIDSATIECCDTIKFLK